MFKEQSAGRVGGVRPPYRDQKLLENEEFPCNLWSRYTPPGTFGATRPPELMSISKSSGDQISFKEIKMSNKLCLVLSVLLTTSMLLTACTPAATPTAAPVPPAGTMQPTTAPGATTAPVQPTTAPGEIPQSEDLCGGTGGNGQIVSVGDNEFTIKLDADGSDMVVHLTGQATIKTSAGSASLSDLKIGYRVTLVGDRNPDGSFTADTVVVCNGIVP